MASFCARSHAKALAKTRLLKIVAEIVKLAFALKRFMDYLNPMSNTNQMNHKEAAAHIRGKLKAQKIPARVRIYTACGTKYIQINGIKYDSEWTSAQSMAIRVCAQANGLKGARGSEIDMHPSLNPPSFDFEF